jgi:hypothetical protein
MIKSHQVTEGNLRAEKSTSDFGGPNKWHLHIKNVNGYWVSVQWMSVGNIQPLFKEKLPVYEEVKSSKKYKLV